MNIRLKTYYTLKHILNSLNDGTYYVNINLVCLHNNNLFHILLFFLNEHVHMLGKKTGVQSSWELLIETRERL